MIEQKHRLGHGCKEQCNALTGARKVYTKPELSIYGRVKDVTLGSSIPGDPETGGSGTRTFRR